MDNLGDHVLGAGIFRALRTRHREARLIAVVPSGLAELYARCPSIDAILTLPSHRSYLSDPQVWAEMHRLLASGQRFDLVVNPRFAEDWYAAGAVSAALAGPAARVIAFRQAHSPIPRYDPNRCYTELVDAAADLHAARYAAIMAQACTGRPAAAEPEVWFDAQDRQRVERQFDLQSQRYIVVGVGASFAFKRPALDIYRAVLARLQAESSRIVLVGSGAESAFAEALRSHFAAADVVSAVGALRLYELAALLSGARLFVGPDAGPKHIAAAVRAPVLEIGWVPTDYPITSRGPGTGGRCWAAWGTTSRTVSPSREQFDRAVASGTYDHQPIPGLDPEQIARAIGELLESPRSFPTPDLEGQVA